MLYLADGVVRGYHEHLPFGELQGTAALVVEFHLLTLAEQKARHILIGDYMERFRWLQQIHAKTPSEWYETGTILECRTHLRRGNMEAFRDALLREHVDTTIELPAVIDAEQRAARTAQSE